MADPLQTPEGGTTPDRYDICAQCFHPRWCHETSDRRKCVAPVRERYEVVLCGCAAFIAAEPPAPASTGEPTAPTEPISHDLKAWPEYFEALLSGEKTFEFRKDDREPRFAVGDALVLHEYVPPYRVETEQEWSKRVAGDYTGREVVRRVTYVARGGLIPEGYCVMAIVPLAPDPRDAEIARLNDDCADLREELDSELARSSSMASAKDFKINELSAEIARLRAEVERLREALEEIAERTSYGIDDHQAFGEALSRARLAIAATPSPAGDPK